MRNLALTWFGVILTFVATFVALYFSPTPVPLADQLWYYGMCALCVVILVLTIKGRPRDLSQPLPASVRGLAIVAMILSGGAWAWFIVRTVIAEDSEQWTLRVQRTLALFIFAGAYYIAAQRPRRS